VAEVLAHDPVRVQSRLGGQRLFRRDEGGQRLVVDGDALDRIGQAIGIVGHHHRHALADVADDVAREDTSREGAALVRALGAGQDGPRRLGQIGGAPRRDDTGQGPRIAHVDRADARVAMGASHHAEVQQSLAGHVVEIPAGAHEEAAVFLSSRRAADQVAGLVHPRSVPAGARGEKTTRLIRLGDVRLDA
jgi:hypothetical protein